MADVDPEQVELTGSGGSWIQAEAFVELFEAYMTRKWTEDLDQMTKLKGTNAVLARLKTSPKIGLTAQEVQNPSREEAYGTNANAEPERQTLCDFAIEAMKDLTMQILLVAGIVSLILGATVDKHPEIGWIEGFAILIAVAIVVGVTAVNDYQKQAKFGALQEANNEGKSCEVTRDGKVQTIHPERLVVGDILMLTAGLNISADALVLTAADTIMMSEASITGENDSIKKLPFEDCVKMEMQERSHKDDPGDQKHTVNSPCLLSGTQVESGVGTALILCVGVNSLERQVMDLVTGDDEETPLQKKLNTVANDVSIVGLICAVFAVAVLYLRFGIEIGAGVSEWDDSRGPGQIVDFFIVGITVLVVAIPEGLPLAVTISLAYSVMKMQAEQNLVRRLHACETMGGVDNICSDKTGTLTQNVMTVTNMFIDNKDYDFMNNKHLFELKDFSSEFQRILRQSICLNTTARWTEQEEEVDGKKQIVEKPSGSKTEIAMLNWLRKCQYTKWEEKRKKYDDRPSDLFAFSSIRKRSSIVVSLDEGGNRKRAHVKGGAETMLDRCTHLLTTEREADKKSDKDNQAILDQISAYNSQGLRSLVLAFRDLPVNFDSSKKIERENGDFPLVEEGDLTFICVVAIEDPLKDAVPHAVEECNRAQIRVRMVTGDSVDTATAIAKKCNILNAQSGSDRVMTGIDFEQAVGKIVKICSGCKRAKDGCKCKPEVKAKRDKKNQKKVEEYDQAVTKWEKEKEKTPALKKPEKPEDSDEEDGVEKIGEFMGIAERLDVLARSQPRHKYLLVTGLKQMGHIVAVTGDGSNDAPALSKADIGFAMGIEGTDLAKEAAGIIILDDDFSSIVSAVVWGRNIYDNIRRFIQFQLTVNVVAVVSAIIGAVIIKQSPLTAVQMLWVNLIMDTLASLALATEKPDREILLARSPQKRDEYIVSKLMWKHIFGQSIIQLIFLILMIYCGEFWIPELGGTVENGRLYNYDGSDNYIDEEDETPSRHFTFIFQTFVMMQLFNELNSRKIRDEWNCLAGLEKSLMFVIIWVIELVLQIIMVLFGSFAMNCHVDYGLTWDQWLLSIALGFVVMPWRFVLIVIKCEGCMPNLDVKESAPGRLVRSRSLAERAKIHGGGSFH